MNIINTNHYRPWAVKNATVATLKRGIFIALLLFSILYIPICLASPLIENSQEFISSDTRENETSKDE